MSLAFARHLEDFSQPMNLAQISMSEKSSESQEPYQDKIDLEALEVKAYQKGYQAALKALEEQYKITEQNLNKAHQQELTSLEEQLSENMLIQIKDCLCNQIEQNCDKITDKVRHILSLFVNENLVELSVRQLQDLIKSTFSENPSARICVEGPLVLIEKIRNGIGDHFPNFEINETETIEVTVKIDQSVITTKLNEWQKIFGVTSHER